MRATLLIACLIASLFTVPVLLASQAAPQRPALPPLTVVSEAYAEQGTSDGRTVASNDVRCFSSLARESTKCVFVRGRIAVTPMVAATAEEWFAGR